MICLSREREKPVLPFPPHRSLFRYFPPAYFSPTCSLYFRPFRHLPRTRRYWNRGEKRKRKRGHVSRFPRRRYGFLLHGKASGEVRGKFYFSSTASTDPVGLSNVRLPEGRIQKACQQRLLPSLHAKTQAFSLSRTRFFLDSITVDAYFGRTEAEEGYFFGHRFSRYYGKSETTREEEVFHPLERRVVLRPFVWSDPHLSPHAHFTMPQ